MKRRSIWGIFAGFGVLFSLCTGALQAQTLIHESTYVWQTPSVVGLSALEVSADGADFVTLGDQGWYVAGTFARTAGAITGITVTRYLPLLGHDGLPAAARRVNDWSDAEGLAIGPGGEMFVAFERWTRVERYAGPEAAGAPLPAHPGFREYRENRQLESVALHPDGTLYAFSEAALEAGFAIYRFGPEAVWEIAGYIPKSGRYAIVGADFDPSGRLFLLERRHVLGRWFQSRIRLLDVADPGGIRTLWSSRLGGYDNLEGLAVWGAPGALRLTVVADNNAASETTEFLDFRLVE